jgi:hypothetical protein
VESVDPLKRVQASAIPPWQVIVDDTAHSWDNQRFVGHVYMLPVKEAMQRYGKRRDAYTTRPYVKWIESASIAGQKRGESSLGIEPGQDSPYAEWVRVVEMYDLRADKLLVWSPDYKDSIQDRLRSSHRSHHPALLQP